MRSLRPILVLGIGLVACGKSAEERATDVETCSATSTQAAAIARCLHDQSGWSRAAADSAGAARERELSTLQTQLGVIAARADSQHGGELRTCDRVLVDLKSCLITRFGWDEDQAGKTDDSLWASRSAEHQRQIRACLGRRGVGTGACLQLHYKWQPRRALALDDSIRKANLR
jgi:hypothetical protein